MRFHLIIALYLVASTGAIGQDALAASYRRTNGTIVDPMTSAFCEGGWICTYPSPYISEIHPFGGPPLEPGVSIPGADLSMADLRDVDLREADLRNVDFSYSDVRGDLRAADLRLAGGISPRFESAALDHVDLRGNWLAGANLTNADLHAANADGMTCAGLGGSGNTSLLSVNLSSARVRDSYFNEYCSLSSANFGRADLRGSDFSDLDFSDVDLDRADLRGVYLQFISQMGQTRGQAYYDSTTNFFAVSTGLIGGAPFDPVAAGWIDLDEVDVDVDGIPDSADNCRFVANVDQDDFDADSLGDVCDFSPSTACLEMGSLVRSTTFLAAFQDNTCEDWSWVEQPAADLQSAVLTETYLRSANLAGAVMTDADLSGADLTAGRLTNADLSNANLDSAVLAYAHLSFANMTGANLAHADLESADLIDALLMSARYDEETVFPSGRRVAGPPWGLPNGVTPWGAGMIPVPEPGSWPAIMIGGSGIGLAGIGRRSRRQQRNR